MLQLVLQIMTYHTEVLNHVWGTTEIAVLQHVKSYTQNCINTDAQSYKTPALHTHEAVFS